MKIGTQGAEWFIWNGMKQEISRRYFTMVMEMSPWALSASVSPGTFLSEVLQSFHLYDIGNTRQQFVELTMTNLEESIAAIKQRTKPRWTDLLCVSRTFPSSQRLIERIAAAYA